MAFAGQALKRWINADPQATVTAPKDGEVEQARAAIREALRAGASLEQTTPPRLVLVVGAPGAGKNRAAPLVVERLMGKPHTHHTVDFDLAFKYHPNYDATRDLKSIDGHSTGLGEAMGMVVCNDQLEPVLAKLVSEEMLKKEGRFNMILHSHNLDNLIFAKKCGYHITLLYVHAPLSVAQDRSRKRAIETGKFLAPTLSAQDRMVAEMRTEYVNKVPWCALWADEFVVADNGGAGSGAPPFRKVPMRPSADGDWAAPVLSAARYLWSLDAESADSANS